MKSATHTARKPIPQPVPTFVPQFGAIAISAIAAAVHAQKLPGHAVAPSKPSIATPLLQQLFSE